MKRLFIVICSVLILQGYSVAAPMFGSQMTFSQPDGKKVDVLLFGDEFYMRAESVDGYTLLQDSVSGWIHYARCNADSSQMLSTGVVYTGTEVEDNPAALALGLTKRMVLRDDVVAAIVKQSKIRLYGPSGQMEIEKPEPAPQGMRFAPASAPAKETVLGLVLIVDFSDAPLTQYTRDEFDSLWNGRNYQSYGIDGSVRQYFLDVSGGMFEFNNIVYGVYRASKTFAEYDNMAMGVGANQILVEVMQYMDAHGFDFSKLSMSYGKIRSLSLMYTGTPQKWSRGMWYHAGKINNFTADGVNAGQYTTSPATMDLGVACHESGHRFFAWEDTYQLQKTTPDEIGAFDLMCGGAWGGTPSPPNPYFLLHEGWARATEVNSFTGDIRDTANDLHFYKYTNPVNPNEYYLFNAVIRTGRYTGVPDDGLCIWWVNEEGDNQNSYRGEWLVRLVHANNDSSFHTYACFKQGQNVEYGESTTPRPKWVTTENVAPTQKVGLRCWDIGPAGMEMNYKFGNKVCNAVSIAPIVKFSSTNIVQTNTIEFCVGIPDYTLSPTPLDEKNWTWFGYNDFKYGRTQGNTRELTLPGSTSTYFSYYKNYKAIYADADGCVYATTYKVIAHTPPLISTAVRTQGSGWYDHTELRVCAGTEFSLRAKAQKLESCRWNGPGGFSANTADVTFPAARMSMAGVYSMAVIDSYGCSGTQVVTVRVDSFPQPTVLSNRSCGAAPVTLALGNTTGTVRWYDSPTGGKVLATGDTFATPALSQSKDYYYELSTIDSLRLGARDTSIGPSKMIITSGGLYGEYGLKFDASKPFLLKSVKLYAVDTIYSRVLHLMKGGPMRYGPIPNRIGEQRAQLNWWVPAGKGYQIKASFTHMLSNTTGAAYPYTNALATITKSSGEADAEAVQQYHFFYDWEMVSDGCIASRQKITAIIDTPTVASFTTSADTLWWPQTTLSVTNTSSHAGSSTLDFGDKSSATSSLLHQYADTGSYTVALATANGSCMSRATMLVRVHGDISQQTFALSQGWNLISTNRHPLDSTVSSLFNGLNVVEIKTMDAFWRKGQPDAFNSLHSITAGDGYLIYMKTAGTLNVTGTPVKVSNHSNPRQSNWRLIGCPYQTATPFSKDYNASNCTVVKDFEGSWKPNGSANSIQNLETGKGYYIR